MPYKKQVWQNNERLNADKLRGKTSRFANILYDNQQYIKKRIRGVGS